MKLIKVFLFASFALLFHNISIKADTCIEACEDASDLCLKPCMSANASANCKQNCQEAYKQCFKKCPGCEYQLLKENAEKLWRKIEYFQDEYRAALEALKKCADKIKSLEAN